MAKTQYLPYYVHLTDKALVESLNTQYPKGVIRAPYNPGPPVGGMAVEAAGMVGLADPLPMIENGFPVVSPCLTSEWFSNSSNTFPRNVATFTRDSGWWIFGGSTKFYWVARFVYTAAPPGGVVTPAPGETTPGTSGCGEILPDVTIAAPIPVRDFLDGLEILDAGEGSSGTQRGMGRAGAVGNDGFGFAFRQGNSNLHTRGHAFTGAARPHTWNRFYVRLRKKPTVSTEIFFLESGGVSGSGARLAVDASGKLAMYVTASSTTSLVSVTDGQLEVGKRQKIDVLIYLGDDGLGTGTCNAYYFLDGRFLGASTHIPGGLLSNVKPVMVTLGNAQNVATTLEIDFDDWHCSFIPDDKLFRTPAYNAGLPYTVNTLVTYIGNRPAGVPMPQIGFEMFRALGAVPSGKPPRNACGEMDRVNWIKVTDSLDFLMGTKVVLLDNTGYAQSTNWTGDYRTVSTPAARVTAATAVSSTSGAVLAVSTNAATKLGSITGAQGVAAVQVGCRSYKTAAALDGSVGYKIGAAAAVYPAPGVEGTSFPSTFRTALYSPAALQSPAAFGAIEAHYQKGADANASRVQTLLAVAQVVGIFSACDQAPGTTATDTLPVSRGLHNAPYFDTPWFREANPPFSPVVVKGGTYVGNATGFDLTFPLPVAYLTIRPLTSDQGGARYWSSGPTFMKATSIGAGNDLGPGYPRRDSAFTPAGDTANQQMQFLFPISGADTQINANGVTYEYVAVMDPGARFLLAGAEYHEPATGLLPVTDPLESATFLPEFGLFWRHDYTNTTTDELWTKGPGHTTAQASKSQTGTPVASAITFVPAVTTMSGLVSPAGLTFDSGFVTSNSMQQFVYALMRRDDGNNQSGKVIQIGSYVGDGNASRSIPFSPAPGLRPLYAMVQPHNAAVALYRDPSHTGTTSSQLLGTSNAATGITAGAIDSFTVGSVLNANGVTYSWFAFMGGTTAGNNGWAANGDYENVPPDSPIDPTFPSEPNPDDPFPPPDDDPTTPGPTEPTDPVEDPDIDPTAPLPGTVHRCAFFTQRVANRALSHIGVSKQVGDVTTENTLEANLVRLHIGDCVEATLRDFDWPLATRYAALVLHAGTEAAPVNKDWTYAYLAPLGMMKARRLVTPNGRKWDPDPIPFRLGYDSVVGPIIYTNQAVDASDPVTLEYTFRLPCPTYQLDPEFRAALAWRLAADLAMPLSKDSKKQAFCLSMYASLLPKATETAANEQQQELDDDADAGWIAGR